MAAMAAGYFLLPLHFLGPSRPVLSWTVFGCALALIAILLVRQIRDVLVDLPGTRPGLVIPVLMCLAVLVFAAGYVSLARHPGEFTGLETRVDALYFTVVTLATIGFGDITPQGQTARLVTLLQVLYSFVFLTAAATALSRRVHRQLGQHLGRDVRNGPAGRDKS
ncbi:potassium channel family protein [Streptomyces apocyni]|uniref:potassium channel family protein n=1 Tax=Streptomyces apocyni TaxID=2654677 RepID=UPI0018D01886|nr:potassium channel family protein [Streptomyces apocyni]